MEKGASWLRGSRQFSYSQTWTTPSQARQVPDQVDDAGRNMSRRTARRTEGKIIMCNARRAAAAGDEEVSGSLALQEGNLTCRGTSHSFASTEDINIVGSSK